MITTPITRPITSRIAGAIAGARQGGAPNPLVWHAAYPDADGVMQAQLVGVGSPTFSNSAMLLPDFEGVDYTIDANSPPWQGARKVTNRCAYGEDFSTGAWTLSNATKTPGQADPYGGTTATRITATANNGRLRLGVGGSSASKTYVNSIWIKKAGTVIATQLVAPDSNTATTITEMLTTEWKRFSVLGVANANGVAYIGVNISLSGYAVDVAFAQQEEVTTQTNQNPSEYIPTTAAAASKYFNYANGNTVSGNILAEARGAAFAVQPSLYGYTGVTAVFDSANMADTQGAIYLEATTQVAGNILGNFIDVSGATLRVNDGATTATRPWAANTLHKVGIVWHETAMAINVDGAWSADAAYDGTMLSGALDLFRSAADAGTIRDVRGYSVGSFSSGKTTIDGLMAAHSGIGGIKDVVLLVGQSNMIGGADYDDAGGHAANANQWNQAGALVPASIPLDHPYPPAGTMGLDVSFSTEYASNVFGTGLIFVPCAEGSTGFSDNNWNPGDTQYAAAVSRANAALSGVPGSRLLGILWLQGENDAQDSRTEAQYAADLDAMISAMRGAISGAANVPFVACQIPNLSVVSFPTEDDVNAAILDLPNRVSNTAVVANTGLTKLVDGLHYDAASLRSIGVGMFNALSGLL